MNKFAKKPKLAHVAECESCEHLFWTKTRFRYTECTGCESKSLIINPSEISINKREKMWRFLNDDEKETRDELAHDEIMQESSQKIDYDGHWGIPGDYHNAYEMSEDVREDSR